MLPATRKKSFVQHRAKDKVRANSRNKLGWIIIFTPYINIKKLVRDIRLQRLPKDVFPNEIPKFSKFRSSNLGGVENLPKKNKKKKEKIYQTHKTGALPRTEDRPFGSCLKGCAVDSQHACTKKGFHSRGGPKNDGLMNSVWPIKNERKK